MKFSSKIEKCQLSPIRKFRPYALAAAAKGRKIYHLNIGQPDIATPDAFFEAVRGFRQPVLEYAPSEGLPELLEAVQRYYERIGVHFERDEILTTSGGSEALEMVLQCILDDGDEILSPEPFYPNYSTFVNVTGGSIHPIPTTAEEGYRYADRARIEAEINEHTRAILITNPGNPTGVVLTEEEMRLLVEIAREHHLFLVADEVYREFVYEGQALESFAKFTDAAENVIIIDSVSKRFSACGARIGMVLSHNRELMDNAMKYCQGRLCSATLDQVGAAALYGIDPDYFTATREEYKHRRDACMEGLRRIPGVVCKCPQGAFYIMAKLPVDDTEKFQIWLLEHFEDHGETVMFTPGEGFYATPGKGRDEIRLAYILKEQDVKRAMELLALGIQAYQKAQAD